jgi:hypothetical protein
MAVIAQETQHYSNVVKREFEPEWGYCKKVITLNGPAATLPIGSVLGLVTATGKYKLTETTATDGSQNPSVVIVGDSMGRPVSTAVAANTDTKFLVIYRGPAGVADSSLTYGASVTAGALRLAAQAALTANSGIDVLFAI